MSTQELVKRHLLTRADYHRMAEAGVFEEDARVELIEGEIFDRAPIGSEHGSRTARLINVFIRALGERAIVVEQHSIQLGDLSEPEPDIVVVDPKWNFNPDAHPTAGEILLVVEVAYSSLRHDRERKLPLYARYGIPEVWLIDLNAHQLFVHRQPQAGRYVEVNMLERGSVSPAAFPDLALAVELIV